MFPRRYGPIVAAFMPSVPSSLNFGVEPLQFHADIFDAKLPATPILSLEGALGDSSMQAGQREKWLDDCSFPGEVDRPVWGAWIEHRHQPPCLWIK